ncbi:copper chaperone PCu(A)C [Streptomyces ziwulingensis]|uniref:Copper chaperone PCu(A)C n=1 Tax=Streptomyces ziwulingensis TaxID=1045501 RepID=A0ABP9BHJ0_9ACTN
MSRPALSAAVLVGALFLAGCGADDSGPGTDGSGSRADLSVGTAYMPQPVSDSMAAGFLTVTNDGAAADELTGVTSDVGEVTVHKTVDGTMREVDTLPVPAHGKLVLQSGGDHLMFDKMKRKPKEGQEVAVELHFADSGPVTVEMPVEAATYRPSGERSGH